MRFCNWRPSLPGPKPREFYPNPAATGAASITAFRISLAGTADVGAQQLGEVPVVPVAEVTVVWASAQPLLDALRSTFPADFANHYVIGVNDLPATEGGRKVNQESMTATLRARGERSMDAGGILPTRETVLFAFSKELLPLTPADKEVLFTLETNQYSIKTRFDLKEMMYRGRLAV